MPLLVPMIRKTFLVTCPLSQEGRAGKGPAHPRRKMVTAPFLLTPHRYASQPSEQAKIVISRLQTKQVNREGCTVGRTKVGPIDTPNISDGVVPCLEPHRAGNERSRPKILFLALPRTIDKNS